jgi:glycosyltransferase involved in cell wall biosynthesis
MAPQHRPSISIGLPVYNGERYLSATLDCFLAQTFGDFELTICEDRASVPVAR